MGQLADALEARQHDVLRRWAERVRAPDAPGGVAPSELSEHLPEELRRLVAALREPAASEQPPSARRWRPGVDLEGLVREYGLWRDVLLDFIEQEGLPATSGEVRRLHQGLDMALTQAVREHGRAQERQRLEEAQAQGARLSSLFEQAPGLVAHVSGPEQVFDLANAVFSRLMGERPLLGRTVREAFPELVGQPFLALLERAWRSGESVRASELPVVLEHDGQAPVTRTVDFVFQPTRGLEEEVDGVLVYGLDVTDTVHARREAEAAQAERELARTRMDALFMQAPVAIAVIRGPRLVIDLANPLMCRLWGRTREQVLGRPLLEALPELVGQHFEFLLRQVMETGEAFVGREIPARLVRQEGLSPEELRQVGDVGEGYFNLVYEPLRDAAGVIEGVLNVATEVTEEVLIRREVEALLARSQEAERARAALMEALTAQGFMAVASLRGPQFVFEMANPLYRQLVGRDVVGLPLMEALPEVAGQGFDGLLERVLHTGEPLLIEEMPVRLASRGDGVLHEALLSFIFQPVHTLDGQVDGVLVLMRDVTEAVRVRQAAQRRMEEERMRRDFEQQLIGIVSHDLRNPLGAILLGARVLLRRVDLDPRAQQTAARIQGSAERSMRLVRDLLDFTQARLGGGLKLKREPVDLHAVAREAVDELRSAHPERELHLEHDGDGQGAWDADRFAQVVDNLVGNALKYSPPDSAVTVRVRGLAGEVLLEVHNPGEPIAPEALPRLFEPLQRAVSEVDKASRSVGLGLYIVDQIVRTHGGGVDVTSTREAGTTFHVRLPRRP